ncbi:galactose mutarotase-like protein [Coprinellus micaceus]|uniref:Galactose mutarotase-like protein n=1 Tax=Coprinellus micaceus TaxID=71717 RepID=A0A4Y7TJ39_COPMI|nr:galactose mutarotase-like protein [Coprinellus micaceus]
MSEFEPIRIANGPLSLEVLPYGVTIHRFLVKVGDHTHDIVIGPEDPSGHKTQKYTNSIVGRYANRIPVGTHTLERGKYTSTFAARANETPRVSLHGGPVAWDAVSWAKVNEPSLLTKAEVEKLKSLDPASYAVFRLTSANGDQGYPGKLTAETVLALVKPEGEGSLGAVAIVYRAKLDDEATVTPVNLTQHWGFNLNASLPSHDLTVKTQTLNLEADHLVVRDSDNFSKGFADTTQDAVHNHNRKVIGENYPEAGYDDYYLLKQGAPSSAPTRVDKAAFTPELDLLSDIIKPTYSRSVGELASSASGLKVSFDSNQHGLMVYTNGLSSASKGARKHAHGGSGISNHGDSYGPGDAVFIEFHHPLHAFLDPKNKDGEDTLLTSDEVYHNFVRASISLSK